MPNYVIPFSFFARSRRLYKKKKKKNRYSGISITSLSIIFTFPQFLGGLAPEADREFSLILDLVTSKQFHTRRALGIERCGILCFTERRGPGK